MKKFDELQFLADDTNKIISTKISKRVLEVSLEEITEELSKQFVFQEESIKRLYTATATGQNAILYGPGGFSKSKLVVSFYELLGIPLTFKVGHEECTTEELLGMPNINKMLTESKIETAFENSIFCKPGILILEEGLDIPPTVAACLKDIISQRGLREGNTFKESRISNIIIIGNKSPSNMGISDTLKAFYNERFPIQHLMVWKDFSPECYFKFFQVYFGNKTIEKQDEFLLLSELCSKTKEIVSPRIAAAGGDVVLTLGINHLDTVTGIDSSDINHYRLKAETKSRMVKENSILKVISERLGVVKNTKDREQVLFETSLISKSLNSFSFSSTNIKEVTKLNDLNTELINECLSNMSLKYDIVNGIYYNDLKCIPKE